FFEIVRRLLLIPTIRRLAAGNLVFGILIIPFGTFLSFFLEERWGLGPGPRGLFFAGISGVAIIGLGIYGQRGGKAFNRDPGSVVGVFFLNGIDRRFGIGGSIVALLVPGVIGSLIIASARSLVAKDLDRMIDEVIETEEIKKLTASGQRLPMLACRSVDFSYGQ